MFILTVVVILVIALLLTLVVLVQNPKGGGLSATFSGQNQFMGVRKTTDFLEKSTWIFAIALLFLSVISVAFIDKGDGQGVDSIDQEMNQKIQELPDALPANTLPVEEAPAEKAPAEEAPAAE